jgi:heme exporter protein D
MEFLSMGKYTVYVWSSVGWVCLLLSFMAWRAHAKFSQLRQAIAWSKDAFKS